jgi:hypothetical protein
MRPSIPLAVAAALLIVSIALMTTAAYPQEPSSPLHPTSGRSGPPGPQTPPKNPAQIKAEESAYKAALERIPLPQQKYDPWQRVREK